MIRDSRTDETGRYGATKTRDLGGYCKAHLRMEPQDQEPRYRSQKEDSKTTRQLQVPQRAPLYPSTDSILMTWTGSRASLPSSSCLPPPPARSHLQVRSQVPWIGKSFHPKRSPAFFIRANSRFPLVETSVHLSSSAVKQVCKMTSRYTTPSPAMSQVRMMDFPDPDRSEAQHHVCLYCLYTVNRRR